MYRFIRKVHLWIGLILAAVLIIEAVTGLILAEPGWFGEERLQKPPAGVERQAGPRGAPQAAQEQQPGAAKSSPRGVYSLAKGLHQGKVGNLDLGWVVDVSAIGLVVLAVTGVYIAIPLLRARSSKC